MNIAQCICIVTVWLLNSFIVMFLVGVIFWNLLNFYTLTYIFRIVDFDDPEHKPMGEEKFQDFLASFREEADGLKAATDPPSIPPAEPQPSTSQPKSRRKTPPWIKYKLRVKLLPVEEDDSDTVDIKDEDTVFISDSEAAEVLMPPPPPPPPRPAKRPKRHSGKKTAPV